MFNMFSHMNPVIKKSICIAVCVLLSFSCVGCLDSNYDIATYSYSENPDKKLYLLSNHVFVLSNPNGFSGSYVIDDQVVRLATSFNQIDMQKLPNGNLVDPEGYVWYKE